MKDEALGRISKSLAEEADSLWTDMEDLMRQPVIQPEDVLRLLGPTVGKLRGLSAAVGWHSVHEEE